MKNIDFKSIVIAVLLVVVILMGITIAFRKEPTPTPVFKEKEEKLKTEIKVITQIDSTVKIHKHEKINYDTISTDSLSVIGTEWHQKYKERFRNSSN